MGLIPVQQDSDIIPGQKNPEQKRFVFEQLAISYSDFLFFYFAIISVSTFHSKDDRTGAKVNAPLRLLI